MSYLSWNSTNSDRSLPLHPPPGGQFFLGEHIGQQQTFSPNPGILGPCPLQGFIPAPMAAPSLTHMLRPPMNPFANLPINPLSCPPSMGVPMAFPMGPPMAFPMAPPPQMLHPMGPPPMPRPILHHLEAKMSKVDDGVESDEQRFIKDKAEAFASGVGKLSQAPSRSIPEPPRISEKILWEYPTPLVDRSKSKGQYPRPPPAPVISSARVADFDLRAPSFSVARSGDIDHGDTIPLMLRTDQRRKNDCLEGHQESCSFPEPYKTTVKEGEIPLQLRDGSCSQRTTQDQNAAVHPSDLSYSSKLSAARNQGPEVAVIPFNSRPLSRSISDRSNAEFRNISGDGKLNELHSTVDCMSSSSYNAKDDQRKAEAVKEMDDEDDIKLIRKYVMDPNHPLHRTPDLPDGWIETKHSTGLHVYLHRESRVATFARPYELGDSSELRSCQPPLASVPCLAWKTPSTLDESESKLSVHELHQYCRKRFRIEKAIPKQTNIAKKKKSDGPVFRFPVAMPNGQSLTMQLSKANNPRTVMAIHIPKIYGDVSFAYHDVKDGQGTNALFYICNCLLKNEVVATGVATTKKVAHNEAAYKALMKLVPEFPVDILKKDFKWTSNVEISLEEKLRKFFQDRVITDTTLIDELINERNVNRLDIKPMPTHLLGSLLDISQERIKFSVDLNVRPGHIQVILDIPDRFKRTTYSFQNNSPVASKTEMLVAKEMAAHQLIREEFPLMVTWWEVVKAWLDMVVRRAGGVNPNPAWPEVDRIKFKLSRMTYLCCLLRKKKIIVMFQKMPSWTGVRYQLDHGGPWMETDRLEQIEALFTEGLRARLAAEGHSVDVMK